MCVCVCVCVCVCNQAARSVLAELCRRVPFSDTVLLSGIMATTANHRPPFVTAGLRGTPSGRRSWTAVRVETITFVWLLSDRAAADQWSNPRDYSDCVIDMTL